ncbi:MAG TPA: macrolide ABC transporter ATP-binding protein [Ruminiclostridium sp.]|nr:macrolide ABC transporter ATP-binding protein [Ruminiclostridium sp.]
MIQTDHLTKHYQMGDNIVKALDDVTLHIPKGSFVSIVGPSGSGKSTLMNQLGCLDIPTSGHYRLDGIEVSTMNDNQLAEIRNQKIGFVFQGFDLISKLTAIENVELPLIYAGVGSRQREMRAKEALDKVGLSERIHHIPAELSGGQQQRVAIARALITNPPLILADEPTGNLDSHSGQEIMGLFKSLYQNGNTIVIITHDEHIAEQAQRILRILDGRIVEDREVS